MQTSLRMRVVDAGRFSGNAPVAHVPLSDADRGEAAAVPRDTAARRRINGKRKIMHDGAHQGEIRPRVPTKFIEPASRRRWDGCGEHGIPEGAIVDVQVEGLGHGVVGPDMPQATAAEGGAHLSRPRGWTCGGAPCGDVVPRVGGTPPEYDDAYGELNTLKSTSSSSSAAAGPGVGSSGIVSGAVAASHSPLGVD